MASGSGTRSYPTLRTLVGHADLGFPAVRRVSSKSARPFFTFFHAQNLSALNSLQLQFFWCRHLYKPIKGLTLFTHVSNTQWVVECLLQRRYITRKPGGPGWLREMATARSRHRSASRQPPSACGVRDFSIDSNYGCSLMKSRLWICHVK